jgi:Nif-specific regulatory protein
MRLVARNGPLSGTALAMADGLTISDPDAGDGAGRPCCRLAAGARGGFVLHALDPRMPVFVNGLPVTMRVLDARDELRIGNSLFVVYADDPAPPSPLTPCSVAATAAWRTRPAAELRFEDALLSVHAESATRDGRDLASLLRVSAALNSVRGLASLDSALAGLVLDVVPADVVVLTGGDEGSAAARSAWTTEAARACEAAVDPALLDRVAQERVAVLVEAAGRQAIVAPMMAFGRAIGNIWAEGPRGAFDERHVRLLLVVASLAAVAREQALEAERLQESNDLLKAEINLDHNMVGRSRPMRSLFERIGRVARSDATILLRGESGTGKELVARAVHRNSARASRPFIAINCAALTESLLESELFGHEKGAFTGAVGLKKGKLELADGGTLFLDEIGELPAGLQAKLLRALQEREFDRVGGTRPVRVDFRLVAATNRDLESAVKAGAFRQDLFYRLNVVALSLPALRDRRDDVPLLADYFVRKHAPRCGRRIRGIAPDALALLASHDWPGNVRELENVIEQALVLGADDRIVADDLPPGLALRSSAPTTLDYHVAVDEARRELILKAFERAGHSHANAARLLGVHPNYLHRLVRNLNLRSRIRTPNEN